MVRAKRRMFRIIFCASDRHKKETKRLKNTTPMAFLTHESTDADGANGIKVQSRFTTHFSEFDRHQIAIKIKCGYLPLQ